MPAESRIFHRCAAFLLLIAGDVTTSPISTAAAREPAKAEITVLYDAFGKASGLQKDWGYAAFIEYGGKRILFDTGNNPDILEQNSKATGINLAKLDFVVMSHRHGDHMGGMTYLLKMNPRVNIFAPKEGFGVYGSDLPGGFYRKDGSLPAEQRYFDGAPPKILHLGSAWPGANIQLVDKNVEIASDVHLISLVSDKPGTRELRELSLAINTPDGMVIVVGCSHPGIDKIVEAAAAVNPRIHFIVGGFHLAVSEDAEIQKMVRVLHETFKVEYVAPGHCTGEPAFAAFKKRFGDRYLYVGLGTTITLGPKPHAVAKAEENASSATARIEWRSR
jgi:7,8-dihydropterin-6-yl-methyl-4-(beta-D-ribofuranosyl)aminobenzene 5'-phosphate synthase